MWQILSILHYKCKSSKDHSQQLVHILEDQILSFYTIMDLEYIFEPHNDYIVKSLTIITKKLPLIFCVKNIPLP